MNMTMRKKALGDLGKLMGRSDLGAGLSKIIAGQQMKSGNMKMAPADELIHLLSRTSFGLTQAELTAAEAVGQDAWLQQQLDHQSIDDSELEGLLTTAFPSLNMTYNEIFEALNSDDDFRPAIDLIVATILRQIASPKQLFEVMTEFWTNHFNVFIFDGPVEYFKSVDDRVNIRPHVLGTFSDMLSRQCQKSGNAVLSGQLFKHGSGTK